MPEITPKPARGQLAPVLPVVGLTGGIASGKSTVSALLAEWGAHVIDADRVGHQVIAPDGEAYPEVVAAYGREVLADDGTISRPKLGAIVFADPAQLARLNAISHPLMARRVAREIAAVRARTDSGRPQLIVLDAAILFEAGWDSLCDRVWVVVAEPETAIARLMARNGLSREQAESRLAAQMSNAERTARADALISNEGSLEALTEQVRVLWAGEIASRR